MRSSTLRLARQFVDILVDRDWSLAIAESCTGGLLAAYITACPGVSRVFFQGFVCYANTAKTHILGVEQALMERHGSVSAPVAKKMASGAAKFVGSDLGLGLTGIAGPDGGTDIKPVGLVFCSLNVRANNYDQTWKFAGSRSNIREAAVAQALKFSLETIRDCPLDDVNVASIKSPQAARWQHAQNEKQRL